MKDIDLFIFHSETCDEPNSPLPYVGNNLSAGNFPNIKGEYKLVEADKDEEVFPDYMDRLMDRQGTNRYELANLLDFSQESLKKRLNCSDKFIAKRDLIIALCLLLQANEFGIGQAIQKYNEYKWRRNPQKWHPFFSRDNYNDRDTCIIENIDEVYRMHPPVSKGIITEINRRLIAKGYGSLDLVNSYNKKENACVRTENKSEDDRFIVTGRGVYNLLIDDPFGYEDSLESQYALTRTDCSCMFNVRDTVTGKRYRLRYFAKHYGGETMFLDSRDDGIIKGYKSVDETFGFKPLFQELRKYTLDHRQKLLKILNDTRNYESGTRISANLHENAIHVFMEAYNFQFPEECEYYLFEYSQGKYKLSVHHSSCFMYHYLQEAEYYQVIGKQKPIAYEEYSSQEEIDIKDEDETTWYHSVAWHRRKTFAAMKLKVDALLEELKTGKKTIRDYDGPFGGDPEGPAVVCRYLGLEKEFDCQDDKNGIMYFHGRDETEISDENGNQCSLSISEVIRAFELGYHNRHEIIENKNKYGKIDEVF